MKNQHLCGVTFRKKMLPKCCVKIFGNFQKKTGMISFEALDKTFYGLNIFSSGNTAWGFINNESFERKKFSELPGDWICPTCGSEQVDFIEIIP